MIPFRMLIPRTIFGRIFSGIFLVALVALAMFWHWFNQRFYSALDTEADNRLRNMAQTISEQIIAPEGDVDESAAIDVFRSLWQFEEKGGWLQNLYWLDVSQTEPRFIASFSARNESRISLLPPSPEEIEDLVFANINDLEKGLVVSPDPFGDKAARRFKIILFPVLDQYQLLESVIGIEADLQYLRLAESLRDFFSEILVVSFLASFLVALIIAGNISKKTGFLLEQLKLIEKDQIPAAQDLNLVEFDLIHQGLIDMANEIAQKDRNLKEFFARKLEELSFTGGAVAHEIRNPLSAIEMHFGLLKRKLQRANAGAENEFKEIEEQLQHLRRLVESFLSYSRRVQPEKQQIDLKDFIERIIESHRGLWSCLVFDLNINDEALISFDRTMLQQICENILNNAAAAADGESLSMSVSFIRTHWSWKLIFANNGPKIPDELLERLFTPFASARPGGNGIGLALVRKLVEAHNGEIICRNIEKGVAFEIEVND